MEQPIANWISNTAADIFFDLEMKDTVDLTEAGQQEIKHRIAAIVATFAEPLMALLQESKREHYHCDDSWYCCGKCTHQDHVLHEGEYLSSHGGEAARTSGACNCGADKWNARVDAVLAG